MKANLNRFDRGVVEQLQALQEQAGQLRQTLASSDYFKDCACNEWGLCCMHAETDYLLQTAIEHVNSAREELVQNAATYGVEEAYEVKETYKAKENGGQNDRTSLQVS